MSKTIIPANYTPALNLYDTQRAIGTVKRLFADTLCATLNLYRVSAPLFLEASTGLNDDELPKPLLRTDVMEMSDLKEGMVLTGTVRNVTDFGAFVDIAVHEDGLVHISQISKRRISHPSQVLKVGDIVQVKVLEVDLERRRISLTMKDL